jgi:hypothetical protein
MTAGSSGGLRVRDPRRAFVFLPKLSGALQSWRAAFLGAAKALAAAGSVTEDDAA